MDNMDNIVTQYEMVAGVFLPLLIAIFIKKEWNPRIKIAISFGFVLLAAVGQAVVTEMWNPENLVRSVITVLVLTITTYKAFWPLTGLTDLIERDVGLTSK